MREEFGRFHPVVNILFYAFILGITMFVNHPIMIFISFLFATVYFVIVYKILSYLYVKLKSGEDVNPNMITHDNQLLQINRKYWDYIMRNLIEDGYITCETEKVWGIELIYDLKTAEITPEGIAYVCNNSLIEKAKEFLKDIKEITPFI